MTDQAIISPVLESVQASSARVMSSIAKIAESVAVDVTSAWWLDPRDLGIGDHPGFLPRAGYAAQLLNRIGRGEYIPAFLSEGQLEWYRRRIRALVVNNEIAINAVNQRISYAIGTGLRYEVSPRRTDVSPDLVSAVQTVLDAFVEHNELPLKEAEILSRMDIDGEAFVRCFPRKSGILSLRFIEPEFVRSPDGDSSENAFGVISENEDVENVVGYWVAEDPDTRTRLTRVDATEILHVKHPETPSTSKRGLSAFYPIETTLKAVEDLLISTVTMAKARAKIAWIQKLSGTTSSLAQQLTNNQADYTATDPVTGNTINMERYHYGSIIRIPSTGELEMPNANIAASDHVAVMQMVLRIVASRFSMPEYLLSSDASNANYASTMVAESPFVKSMERLQDYLGRVLGRNRFAGYRQSLIWRQIFHAVKVGLLPGDVARLVDVQVEGPSLVVRDPQKEAQVDQIYNGMKVKSKKTIQLQQGLDPDEEKRNLAEEKEDEGGDEEQAGLGGMLEGEDSLPFVEAGFTGEKKDKAGRRICYADGKRVACPKKDDPKKPEPKPKKEDPKKKPPEKKAGKVTPEDTKRLINKLVKGATAEQIKDLEKALGGLTIPQLKEIGKALGISPRGVKASMVGQIADNVALRAKKTKPEPPKPKPQPKVKQDKERPVEAGEFWQKNPDDPTAKAIRSHKKASEVTERIRNSPTFKDALAIRRAIDEEQEAFKEYRKTGRSGRWLKSRPKAKAAKERKEQVNAQLRKELLEVMRPSKPINFNVSTDKGVVIDDMVLRKAFSPTPNLAKNVNEGFRFIRGLADGNLFDDSELELENSNTGRAYCGKSTNGDKKSFIGLGSNTGPGVIAHEIGHHLENISDRTRKRVQDFIKYRIGDEKPVDMSTVPGGGRMKGEMVRKDNFDRAFNIVDAHYIGKVYPTKEDGTVGTEILSMGIQKLYEDPAGFFDKDPEYAQFVLSCLSSEER